MKLFINALIFAAGALTVGIIGYSDYISGPELAFSIFYSIPILAATWFSGRKQGLALSLLSAAVWFFCEISTREYSNSLFAVWNSVARLGFFTIQSLLLSSLKSAMEREISLASTDSLTGAMNTRRFLERIEEEILRSRRYGRLFALIYMDIDDFKKVNDTMGHGAGDDLLKAVAETSRKIMRNTDVIARLGGDEFAFLLPETGLVGASDAAEKLRVKLDAEMLSRNWPVTFSFGAAAFSTPPASADDAIKKADSLMYEVKKMTKNGTMTQEF